jgi:RNA polymerase sigma factor (sigma-70 family)
MSGSSASTSSSPGVLISTVGTMVQLRTLKQDAPDGPPGRDWDAHIRRYNHRVILALVALGLRLDNAKDVAQATWVKLIEADRQGKLSSLELPGIALKQARFLAIDGLRKDRSEERRSLGLAAEDRSPTAADPEAAAIAKEQLDVAFVALSQAPASSQRVFRLLYEEPRLPHAQAAERLNLSTQRVRQILCEVRKSVRTALERGDA